VGNPSAFCPSNTPSPDATPAPLELNCPTGVTVDQVGNVYVADQINNRVEVFAQVVVTPVATMTTVVDGATVDLSVPPETTPIANVAVTTPSVTPTAGPISPAYQPLLAIQILATSGSYQPITQVDAPVTISLRFTPPPKTNANMSLAQIYALDPSGNLVALSAQVVANGDGTFTITAQTSDLTTLIVFAPGKATPVPISYLPVVVSKH
jgi:hypothetical protein